MREVAHACRVTWVMVFRSRPSALVLSLSLIASAPASAAALPGVPARVGPPLEVVHTFTGHMPVGVAVNSQGRIFVSYPRWEDEVPYSIAELVDGRTDVSVRFPSGDEIVSLWREGGWRDNFAARRSYCRSLHRFA